MYDLCHGRTAFHLICVLIDDAYAMIIPHWSMVYYWHTNVLAYNSQPQRTNTHFLVAAAAAAAAAAVRDQ